MREKLDKIDRDIREAQTELAHNPGPKEAALLRSKLRDLVEARMKVCTDAGEAPSPVSPLPRPMA